MRKELTIIVPVYNGEKYLARCIESLLVQQWDDSNELEILVLNDGSTDGSSTMLDHYQTRYPSIVKVITQTNHGAAYTRNKGIDLAQGRYILFVDQDDYIDETWAQRLYDGAVAGGYDVLQAGFKRVGNDCKVTSVSFPRDGAFGKFLSVPAWTKIHRSQFLHDNHIQFLDNDIGEDNVFTVMEIVHTRAYGTLHEAGYNNSFENENSVTNVLHKGLAKHVNFVRLMAALYDVRSTENNINSMLDYNILRTAAYYLLSYGRTASPKRFLQSKTEIFAWLNENMKGYATNYYVWHKPAGDTISAYVGTVGLIVLYKLHISALFARLYCRGKTE